MGCGEKESGPHPHSWMEPPRPGEQMTIPRVTPLPYMFTEVSQDLWQAPLAGCGVGRAVPVVCFFRRNSGGFSLERGVQWAHALTSACGGMSVSFRTFSVKCFTENHYFSLLEPEATLYPLVLAGCQCLYFSVQKCRILFNCWL